MLFSSLRDGRSTAQMPAACRRPAVLLVEGTRTPDNPLKPKKASKVRVFGGFYAFRKTVPLRQRESKIESSLLQLFARYFLGLLHTPAMQKLLAEGDLTHSVVR